MKRNMSQYIVNKPFHFHFHFRYIPPRLWGFSGHIQTILHSVVGRVRCPWPLGERIYLSLSDGSTLTYGKWWMNMNEGAPTKFLVKFISDLYQPMNGTSHEDDITVAVCPGIGNSSESIYIRSFTHYAVSFNNKIIAKTFFEIVEIFSVITAIDVRC